MSPRKVTEDQWQFHHAAEYTRQRLVSFLRQGYLVVKTTHPNADAPLDWLSHQQ